MAFRVAGCVAAFLAPPFTGLDTLPALGVVLLSLAVLLEDFAIVVAALIIGVAGVVLEIVLGTAAIKGLFGLATSSSLDSSRRLSRGSGSLRRKCPPEQGRCGCLRAASPTQEDVILPVKHHTRVGSLAVQADARGLVSRSGTALVAELAGRLGVTAALSEALVHLHRRRPTHDPGRVLVDLAVMLIDGGECVLTSVRWPTSPTCSARWRHTRPRRGCCTRSGPAERGVIRAARAAARERAWKLGARPERIVLDFDSHLVEVHSEKEGAAPNRKHGFGFHPLGCWLERARRWQ